MQRLSLSAIEARRIILAAGASPARRFDAAPAGVVAALRAMGYAQIDTISVVVRAHDHVFATRVPGYGIGDLSRLEASPEPGSGRLFFEYWAHAAAYLPMEELPYCLPRMRRIRERGHEWFSTDSEVAAYVLERVRAEGPLSSKDFEDPRGKAGSWWDWKPAKRALEYLFHAGLLLVSSRQGFQKRFDLAERVVPGLSSLEAPDAASMASHYVDRAIASAGLFCGDEIAYGRKDGTSLIRSELGERSGDGRLAEVELEGIAGPPLYVAPEATWSKDSASGPVRAAVLSPFDPFVIDRRRVRRFFGVDYALECYLPEAKRRFGYFALPILTWRGDGSGLPWDGGVGALLDAKAERAEKRLVLRRLAFLEGPGSALGAPDEILEAVAAGVRAFASSLGCPELVVQKIDDGPGVPKGLGRSGSPRGRSAEALASDFSSRFLSRP